MDKQRLKFLKNLKKFWLETSIPNISETNWKFLNFLVKKVWAKSWLEIWAANWYSTIWLGDAFEENWWKLLSYEIWKISFTRAVENIKNIWLDSLIEIRGENFLKCDLWKISFDFVFIDARKSEYLDYINKIIPFLRPGAILIFDDVIKLEYKMKNLFKFLDEQKKFNFFTIPIDKDDWVMILTLN